MLVSAHDVARELRDRLPDVGVTKIHKMLYYAQGWSLARTGEPLFSEHISAWANGPVVATLWHDEDKQLEIPPALELDEQQTAIVDEVIERYGHLTAAQLSEMTHQEAPWRNAAESEEPNPPIRRLALLAHFATERGMERALGIRTDSSMDEDAARLEASIITDPNALSAQALAQVDDDARRLAADHASRAS
jgi:uncharacterized phage-associated protein